MAKQTETRHESMLLRANEVATELATGRSTVYELIAEGKLATVRIGRSVRVTRASLKAFVGEQANADRRV